MDKLSFIDLKTGFYDYLEVIESKLVFKYIAVLICTLLIAFKMNINLNFIFGISVGIIIIFYMNDKNNTEKTSDNKELLEKIRNICPVPKKLHLYTELVDFVFSIKEFYNYNPLAFQEMLETMESMLDIYENVKIGVLSCKNNYDIANDMKKKSVNNLHSIIFTLENNRLLTTKLSRAIKRLQKLLTKYTNEIIEICQTEIDISGYNNNSHIIDEKGPKAFNVYEKNDYTFDFY